MPTRSLNRLLAFKPLAKGSVAGRWLVPYPLNGRVALRYDPETHHCSSHCTVRSTHPSCPRRPERIFGANHSGTNRGGAAGDSAEPPSSVVHSEPEAWHAPSRAAHERIPASRSSRSPSTPSLNTIRAPNARESITAAPCSRIPCTLSGSGPSPTTTNDKGSSTDRMPTTLSNRGGSRQRTDGGTNITVVKMGSESSGSGEAALETRTIPRERRRVHGSGSGGRIETSRAGTEINEGQTHAPCFLTSLAAEWPVMP